MSCELEGVGLSGNRFGTVLAYSVPFLTLTYVLAPSLALGVIMSHTFPKVPLKIVFFLLFSLGGYAFFNMLHTHYYGVGILGLFRLAWLGAKSSLSRVSLENGKLVQSFSNGTRSEVYLRGGQLLWYWTTSPLLVFKGSSEERIVLLAVSFRSREFRDFLECLAEEVGLPKEKLSMSYFRGFVLSGFRYRRRVDFPS
ncbi:hypothetical protein [Hydrogenivirga sp.]